MTLAELKPDLYRQNAFRVTGLPVRATAREVRRHTDRLLLMERLGKAGTTQGMLPPERPFDEDATKRAVQRLRDPVVRLVDELFWLWPVDGDDAAMAALLRGEPDEALHLWEHTEAGPAGAVATHNLAVFSLVKALESDELDDDCLRSWRRAYACWAKVIADDTFWDLVRARAEEFDDPRLTARTVRRMRDDLPAALLSISAQLAARAVREGRLRDARRHAGVMSRSGQAPQLVDDALRAALEPEASRMKALCEGAYQQLKPDPGRGDELAERLLDEAKPLLRVLTEVLPDDHWAVRDAGDDLAQAALACVVAFVNATKENRRALELLDHALALAVTDPVRDRVQENIDIISDNLSLHACFFCGRDADPSAVLVRNMFGDVNHLQWRTTWRTATIQVPRCARCKGRAARRQIVITALVLLVFVTAIAFVAGVAVEFGLILIGLDVLLMTQVVAFAPGRALEEFPPVRDLLLKRWSFGDRPRGT
ncbi:hypothetical protein [Nonomuraea sp. B1E8]|uniref:hypothetical protein n=1 Tax=unclassified Nonomuraea TaxID=2593643 RepID=UPI00325DD1EC